MQNQKRLLALIASLLLIPMLGIGGTYAINSTIKSNWYGAIASHFQISSQEAVRSYKSLETVCSTARNSDIESTCSDIDLATLVSEASYACAALGVLLIVLVFTVTRCVRGSRQRLAKTFGPTVKVAVVFLCGSILIQGAILAYLAYALPAFFVGFYLPKLVGILAIGTLVLAYHLMKQAFGYLRQTSFAIWAQKVNHEQAPGLHALVASVAEKLAAPMPDNLILGLEPNFYVTAATIQVAGRSEPLKGVSLYLSLPFLRLFSLSELTAVLGHELGHFKGDDLTFSLKFAPTYTSLSRTLQGASAYMQSGGVSSLLAVPAFTTLSFVYSEFAVAERHIGRERELEADKCGVAVADKKSLVTALFKISEYADCWATIRQTNADSISEGKPSRDLVDVFCQTSRGKYEKLDFSGTSEMLLSSVAAHPTDTHPTLHERMTALGMDTGDTHKEMLAPSDTSLTAYLAEPDVISEKLSDIEKQLMLAIGWAALPENKEAPPNEEAGTGNIQNAAG